ncbi:MAG TPA: VPGUxxT family thioredoxin-like (seleno)protein, type 2 [Saprospiraceae bacterium]|nr:VPGUxxT family thioredoxin-like (seleno)protein, type 2 [Saprospiraceae bacterium]
MLSAQSQPVELGAIHWLRSMEQAQVQSQEEQKPILILFQEVPGCATCRNYGREVLTYPLIVEAIETEFIPLVVYNNIAGHDAEILRRYNEPSWNNPVVRIVNNNGEDILPRLSGNYSLSGLASRIRQALIELNGKAPAYVQLLADELSAIQLGTASITFSMHCFWTGEALFGKINGVVKTTAGFQSGKEVVVVEYDPRLMTKAQLDKIAEGQSCHAETQGNIRPDSTPKYYLSKSKYRHIPMTELQKCRVNSALAEKQNPDEFLSPRQLVMVRTED